MNVADLRAVLLLEMRVPLLRAVAAMAAVAASSDDEALVSALLRPPSAAEALPAHFLLAPQPASASREASVRLLEALFAGASASESVAERLGCGGNVPCAVALLLLTVAGPHDATRGAALRLALALVGGGGEGLPAAMPPPHEANALADSAFAALYDVEMWAPVPLCAAGVTPATATFALAPCEVAALRRVCQNVGDAVHAERCRLEATAGGRSKTPQPPAGAAHWTQTPAARRGLGDDGWAAIEAIAGRIRRCLADVGGVGFVKLSSRSPKDSLLLKVRAKELALAMGAAAEIPKDALESASSVVCCAWDALDILCSSARVEEDLDLWLPSSEVHPRFLPAAAIVVRKWVPISHWTELRGWATNLKLNALSQYFVYPDTDPTYALLGHKAAVESMVRAFYETKVAPALRKAGLLHCVIDFGFTPKARPHITPAAGETKLRCQDCARRVFESTNALTAIRESDSLHEHCNRAKCKLDDLEPIVIELNPMCHRSGASMFNWEDDADYSTILDGPFTFRVNSPS